MNKSTPEAMSERRLRHSIILLVLAAAIIFVVSAFPQQMHKMLYGVLFTLIFIVAALSMDRGRGILIKFAVASAVLNWIAYLLNLEAIRIVSGSVIFIFFALIVLGLITQIARSKRVTARVIVESISGYLLLGMIFSLIVAIIMTLNPGAFSFAAMDAKFGSVAYYHSEFIYYSFVTYTTLGYGEIIPLVPYARSLAILIAVSGQIYLTVIIAMLVGKFLSHSKETA